jgi:hypothetical protein
MPVSKDALSCATCTKRHEVCATSVGGLVSVAARLECRALPPVRGVERQAQYPVVSEDHYCHLHYDPDPEAAKARRAAADTAAALSAKVEATLAAGQAELPLGADVAPAPRARRARSQADA